jgi:hypothetical protein
MGQRLDLGWRKEIKGNQERSSSLTNGIPRHFQVFENPEQDKHLRMELIKSFHSKSNRSEK